MCREEVEVGEEAKREAQGKRVVIDKETGKAVEVDMYERGSKKRDPEKLKAIFSSNLEQSIMPADISKCPSTMQLWTILRYEARVCVKPSV